MNARDLAGHLTRTGARIVRDPAVDIGYRVWPIGGGVEFFRDIESAAAYVVTLASLPAVYDVARFAGGRQVKFYGTFSDRRKANQVAQRASEAHPEDIVIVEPRYGQ